MSISLLFRKPIIGKIGEIELDAIISENHQFTNSITSFPVEDGSSISDHISIEPITVTLNGFITNSPVKYMSAFTSQGERVINSFSMLTSLSEEKLPVILITSLKTYRNMYIKSIEFPVDNRTGDSLRFTAVFTRITTVNLKTIVSENMSKQVSKKASKTKKIGKQVVGETTEATKTNASWIYQAIYK